MKIGVVVEASGHSEDSTRDGREPIPSSDVSTNSKTNPFSVGLARGADADVVLVNSQSSRAWFSGNAGVRAGEIQARLSRSARGGDRSAPGFALQGKHGGVVGTDCPPSARPDQATPSQGVPEDFECQQGRAAKSWR
jgi:hypothetical protein